MPRAVEEISQELLELIRLNSQNSYREDNKWKLHYENVMRLLDYEIESYKAIIKDYTDETLTINTIEAEGYMRGLITMVNRFKYEEDNL